MGDNGDRRSSATRSKMREDAGWVIVVDEDDASQGVACATLAAAGYESIGVASSLGLRRLVTSDRSALVLCDISPLKTENEVAGSVEEIRRVIVDRWRVAIMGVQPASELAALARASQAQGFVERGADPFLLLRGVKSLLPPRSGPHGDAGEESVRDACIGTAPWGSVKVLLIDDSEVTLQLMQHRLREAGFDVRIAVALGEAHSIVRGWAPNVIVADVNMPEIRGDDLCARLKAKTRDDVLVVLCSSIEDEELGALAHAAGADGFVSKSHGLDRFMERIALVCRRLSEPIVSVQ